MTRLFATSAIAALLMTNASFAQTVDFVDPNAQPEEVQQAVDCALAENAGLPECLGLPEGGQEITGFVPLVAPFLGIAAVGILAAGGGGGGGSTPATPSTPNTPAN